VILTNNGHVYVGHDNGGFDLVVAAYGHKATYTIASPDISPAEYKDLFGGADVFGPAAAFISLGYDVAKIGPKRDQYEFKLPNVAHRVLDGQAEGTIMDVDKYGNATTNLSKIDLGKVGLNYDENFTSEINSQKFDLTLHRTYADVNKSEPVAILYDSYLQFAINLGNFAGNYNVMRGMKVRISK
jgi:hypothetical protein